MARRRARAKQDQTTIRVRVVADGVDEVVAALRRVTAEAERAAKALRGVAGFVAAARRTFRTLKKKVRRG